MTPRFLADENIDPDLVLGLRRRVDDIDIVQARLPAVTPRQVLRVAVDRHLLAGPGVGRLRSWVDE